jgi:hypothetical protein
MENDRRLGRLDASRAGCAVVNRVIVELTCDL